MDENERKKIEAEEINFFAGYYEGQAYNATGWRLRFQRELVSLLKASRNGRPKRVLSLGCGDGQFELMLARDVEHVTGLDISPEAIALANRLAAKAGITNVDFRCQPLADLAWDDTYDCVVCLGFLHHVPPEELVDLLRQAHSHLAPGGMFFSQDPNIKGMLRAVGRVVMGKNYDKYHSPDERELDPAEISSQLKQAGFSSVEIGYSDLTLTPALYMFAKGPGWPMHLFNAADWLWTHSPVARWSSGFRAIARR